MAPERSLEGPGPALRLGTTIGLSSHGTFALFANLLTVPSLAFKSYSLSGKHVT